MRVAYKKQVTRPDFCIEILLKVVQDTYIYFFFCQRLELIVTAMKGEETREGREGRVAGPN